MLKGFGSRLLTGKFTTKYRAGSGNGDKSSFYRPQASKGEDDRLCRSMLGWQISRMKFAFT